MSGTFNRLSVRTIETLTKPGRHADGGNLYLSISATGTKSWVLFYKHGGRQREMGLGRYGKPAEGGVSLAAAREAAGRYRAMLAAGSDPLEERDRAAPLNVTFGQVADDLIASKKTSWRNEAHARQWSQTLTDYVAPLRPMAVNSITTNDVFETLKPIWTTKPDTASRTRGRIEAVLSAAKARGLRQGPNPAAWRDNLMALLPPPKKLSRGHHRAMPYSMVPAFVASLRMHSSISARATEFAIATAARSAEVLGSKWSEIDVENATWTVPASRMKGGKAEHRKPLSEHALIIVNAMEAVRHSEFVFPGAKLGKHLSEMALEMTLRRMKVDSIATPHGFRSSFRDWVAEETSFPNHVAEMALAHAVEKDVEGAYRRGDLFDKRRKLMDAWSDYCLGKHDTTEAAGSTREQNR